MFYNCCCRIIILGIPTLRRESSGFSSQSDGMGRTSLEASPRVLLSKLHDPLQQQEPQQILTEYLVLDFSSVLGVDATAARSCFLMLIQVCLFIDPS